MCSPGRAGYMMRVDGSSRALWVEPAFEDRVDSSSRQAEQRADHILRSLSQSISIRKPPLLTTTVRWLFLLSGWACLALATVGIFLPVLPTTPFVLLAAWCFSKGSERLHQRLLANPTFGPSIRVWEEHRLIPLPIKILATSIMLTFTSFMMLGTAAPALAKISAAFLVTWGLIFIWTKPSVLEDSAQLPEQTDAASEEVG